MEKKKFEGFAFVEGGVCAAKGFQANGVHCGLAHKALTDNPEDTLQGNLPAGKKKNDLAMIFSETPCAAAAMYTTNKVQAAPIKVTRSHLRDGAAQAVIVNSVNANACNADGAEKAQRMCELAAEALQLKPEDIIVASTGVIGQPLPIEPIAAAVPALAEGLNCEGNTEAVNAIMTTDTHPKEVAVTFTIGEKVCTLGGMLKGSGMIHPNMATTLTFLTTDCAISQEMLQMALSDVVRLTLNRVSVDGDTSTNDMVCVMASGLADNVEITAENDDYAVFRGALYAVMLNLARMCAADGEGATKLIECVVSGASDEESAVIIAKSVITSSLFKAAMYGADANWGRIACAMGYSAAEYDVSRVNVDLASTKGRISVAENGCGIPFSEELAKKILLEDEIQVLIALGDGEASAVAWGCDLTYEYVKINGDYRS